MSSSLKVWNADPARVATLVHPSITIAEWCQSTCKKSYLSQGYRGLFELGSFFCCAIKFLTGDGGECCRRQGGLSIDLGLLPHAPTKLTQTTCITLESSHQVDSSLWNLVVILAWGIYDGWVASFDKDHQSQLSLTQYLLLFWNRFWTGTYPRILLYEFQMSEIFHSRRFCFLFRWRQCRIAIRPFVPIATIQHQAQMYSLNMIDNMIRKFT
jgi:hypothetical protein